MKQSSAAPLLPTWKSEFGPPATTISPSSMQSVPAPCLAEQSPLSGQCQFAPVLFQLVLKPFQPRWFVAVATVFGESVSMPGPVFIRPPICESNRSVSSRSLSMRMIAVCEPPSVRVTTFAEEMASGPV